MNKHLEVARRVAEKVISVKQQNVGNPTSIYFPQESNSIYNDENSNFIYNDAPDITGKMYITNLISEANDSLGILDPFSDDINARVLIDTISTDYPRGSLVIPQLKGYNFRFVIDEIKMVGIKYKKYYLVPKE